MGGQFQSCSAGVTPLLVWALWAQAARIKTVAATSGLGQFCTSWASPRRLALDRIPGISWFVSTRAFESLQFSRLHPCRSRLETHVCSLAWPGSAQTAQLRWKFEALSRSPILQDLLCSSAPPI